LVEKKIAGLQLTGNEIKAIRNYQILTGGSTQLKVYSRQLMMKAIEDCETGTKRDAMLTLGGPQYNGEFLTEDLIAYVHIYLPWSNLSCSRYLPYDSGILTKPISLLFEFSTPTELFSYAVADQAAIIGSLPTQYDNRYLMIQTALMALGPSESIRPAVGPNGDSQYNYGWIYPGQFLSNDFTGVSASANARCQVRLEQFQNGNLQSMTIYLERISLGVASGQSDVFMSSCPNNEAMYEDMTNIEIKYGGQTIYRSDDMSNKLMNLSETWTENEIDFSFPNMTNLAITTPINVNDRKAKWILVNFVQMRESYFKNLVQDGPSVINNMMSIEFNTPELQSLSNGDPLALPAPLPALGIPAVQPQYRLHASYNYLGSVNTYKGFTDFMFLPANAQGPYTMAS